MYIFLILGVFKKLSPTGQKGKKATFQKSFQKYPERNSIGGI